MGNGNIDVGTKTPTRKTGKPIIQRLSGSNGLPELRIDQRHLVAGRTSENLRRDDPAERRQRLG